MITGVTGVAYPCPCTVKPPGSNFPSVTDRSAYPKICSVGIVASHCQLKDTRCFIPNGTGNIVYCPGRCVGIEDRRRTSADYFDGLNGLIETKCLVSIQVA